MYNKLLNNIIDASVMDAGVLEYITSGVYCNLTLVGTAFDHSSFGIVCPKNWLYQQVLDVAILSLREAGIFNSLKNEWFASSFCSRSSEAPPELLIQQLASIFLTFGIISILSLLFYAWLRRPKKKYNSSESTEKDAFSVNDSILTLSDVSIKIFVIVPSSKSLLTL
jgi:hypothetical protein